MTPTVFPMTNKISSDHPTLVGHKPGDEAAHYETVVRRELSETIFEDLGLHIQGLHSYRLAAREIADALAWDDAAHGELLMRMRSAIDSGELRTRNARTGLPEMPSGGVMRLVSVDDINAWLTEQSAPYRWRPMEASDIPTSAGAQPHANDCVSRTLLTRAALIKAVRHEWPTVEEDLREASRPTNADLKAANVRRRMWDLERARLWARSRGKLKEPAVPINIASPWPSRQVNGKER